ncbi:MAG: hypothetical protein ACLRMX_09590 [Lachnospira eligens]
MVKNKKWHIKKIAALAGAVVLAVSSAALYAAPQVKPLMDHVILVIGLMLILM